MEASFFTQVLLPASLALIMFGMGLSLTIADFKRLLNTPRAVSMGLFGQMICLPLMAFLLCLAFSVEPHIAIGLMVLAACPGGTSSNLLSHIGRANLALSVSLTAITTVICVVSTPWLIKFSVDYFTILPDEPFSLLNTSLSLLVITLIPIVIGMSVRHFALNFANRTEAFFRHLSTLFLITMIILISIDEKEMIMNSFPDVFILTFTLNILATVVGVIIARLGRLNDNDAVTLGIEIGTQNATMSILISVSFLNNSEYAIASGVYGVTMYIGAFILIISRQLGWFGFRPKTT
ncbi:MAG: Pantothenate precursors transporter PanS [Glaciecola sp. HTCC2999]|jgi:BASS family bile acid:Na+ symporter|nr:MAG: Pantothenate precursors transporter PanS [Glaciecola sp. HTCC2999]